MCSNSNSDVENNFFKNECTICTNFNLAIDPPCLLYFKYIVQSTYITCAISRRVCRTTTTRYVFKKEISILTKCVKNHWYYLVHCLWVCVICVCMYCNSPVFKNNFGVGSITIQKIFLIWISRSFKKGASDNTISYFNQSFQFSGLWLFLARDLGRSGQNKS